MFPYKELEKQLHLDISAWNPTLGPQALEAEFLTSDMSVEQVRIHMLGRSFYKKLAPKGINPPGAEENALKKFLAINDSIPEGPFVYPVETEADEIFWNYWLDAIQKTSGFDISDVNFDLDFMRSHFTAGPGASLGCDNESFYTKLFAGKISTTSDYLLSLYRALISESDTWSLAERDRFQKFGVEKVRGNRLFFVLKNVEEMRTCCTEPLINMLFQQALGAFLEHRLLRHFKVSLKRQAVLNRELARVGSLFGTFGTEDMTSASDSIAHSLIQRSLRSTGLLGWINNFRSERTILPDGSERELRMVSTMGNAFTFPLQTIIFACAIRAVYQMMNLKSSSPETDFGVFGDDIIVRREAFDFLTRSLTKLGFKVNEKKSFNLGSFRESCGLDWWKGELVRGIYLKSLETTPELYSAINRLNRWSASSGIPLPNVIGFLLRSIGNKTLLIPFSEALDGGYQVPFDMTIPKLSDDYWFQYKVLRPRQRRCQVPSNLEESISLGYKFLILMVGRFVSWAVWLEAAI